MFAAGRPVPACAPLCLSRTASSRLPCQYIEKPSLTTGFLCIFAEYNKALLLGQVFCVPGYGVASFEL